MFRTNLISIMHISINIRSLAPLDSILLIFFNLDLHQEILQIFYCQNYETGNFAENFQLVAKIDLKIKLTKLFLQNEGNGPTFGIIMYVFLPF